MSHAEFSDETGTVRLKGTLKGGGGSGIPQGGPLTADLATGGFKLAGAPGNAPDGFPLTANLSLDLAAGGVASLSGGDGAAGTGGSASLSGGTGDSGNVNGGAVTVTGGGPGAPGDVTIGAHGVYGGTGVALCGTSQNTVVYGGVTVAAAVPVAAPDGTLPFAVDTTPVSGGLYVWNGAAWVRVSAIP